MLLAQQSQSEFFEFLRSIDSDMVGAMMIVGTIFFFVTLIVAMVTISRTVQDIVLIRSNRKMVEQLLASGYSVDDVERLVYGQNRWNVLTRMLGRCRKANYSNEMPVHQPRPPVKMPV